MGTKRTSPTTEQAEARLLADIAGARSERDAKSALFAAAPDLLAALKRMEQFGDIARDFAEGEVEVDGDMVSTCDLLAEARAAIRKAEGNPTT